MVRKLKYHEQKLLRKVDFLHWEADASNLREVSVMRRYGIARREDYTLYNKLSRRIRELARSIKDVDKEDEDKKNSTKSARAHLSALCLNKLYAMGIIQSKQSLEVCSSVNASSFCRRRLPVVLVRLHMAENVTTATTFVRHGHVRVGAEVVRDPAFLVTRAMEDAVTWVDTSAVRKRMLDYKDIRDDYDVYC